MPCVERQGPTLEDQARDEELANLRETVNGMKGHWQAEKDAIGVISKLKEDLEGRRADAERLRAAVRAYRAGIS